MFDNSKIKLALFYLIYGENLFKNSFRRDVEKRCIVRHDDDLFFHYNVQGPGLGLPGVLRRDLRFVHVHGHIFNQSVGKIVQYDIRQFRGQHFLTIHSYIYIPTSPRSVSFHGFKVKLNDIVYRYVVRKPVR